VVVFLVSLLQAFNERVYVWGVDEGFKVPENLIISRTLPCLLQKIFDPAGPEVFQRGLKRAEVEATAKMEVKEIAERKSFLKNGKKFEKNKKLTQYQSALRCH